MAVIWDEKKGIEYFTKLKNNLKDPAAQTDFFKHLKPLIFAISCRQSPWLVDDLQSELMAYTFEKIDKLTVNFDPEKGRLYSYFYHFLSEHARIWILGQVSGKIKFVSLDLIDFESIQHPKKTLGHIEMKETLKNQINEFIRMRFEACKEQDRKLASKIAFILIEGMRPNFDSRDLEKFAKCHWPKAKSIFTIVVQRLKYLITKWNIDYVY